MTLAIGSRVEFVSGPSMDILQGERGTVKSVGTHAFENRPVYGIKTDKDFKGVLSPYAYITHDTISAFRENIQLVLDEEHVVVPGSKRKWWHWGK